MFRVYIDLLSIWSISSTLLHERVIIKAHIKDHHTPYNTCQLHEHHYMPTAYMVRRFRAAHAEVVRLIVRLHGTPHKYNTWLRRATVTAPFSTPLRTRQGRVCPAAHGCSRFPFWKAPTLRVTVAFQNGKASCQGVFPPVHPPPPLFTHEDFWHVAALFSHGVSTPTPQGAKTHSVRVAYALIVWSFGRKTEKFYSREWDSPEKTKKQVSYSFMTCLHSQRTFKFYFRHNTHSVKTDLEQAQAKFTLRLTECRVMLTILRNSSFLLSDTIP